MEPMSDSGFWTLLWETGPVIKAVFAVLLVMSLASWSLIFLKWYELRKVLSRVREDRRALERPQGLESMAPRPGEEGEETPSAAVIQQGTQELQRMAEVDLKPAVKGRVILDCVRHALEDEVQAQADRLHGSLALLATVGNVAPLLGLFGTVWGIMNSFAHITGGADIVGSVAPGLAEALSTTAFGLIVAIPAVLAHNAYLKMLGSIEADLAALSSAFMNRVKERFSEYLTCPPAGPED